MAVRPRITKLPGTNCIALMHGLWFLGSNSRPHAFEIDVLVSSHFLASVTANFRSEAKGMQFQKGEDRKEAQAPSHSTVHVASREELKQSPHLLALGKYSELASGVARTHIKRGTAQSAFS